MRDLCLLILSVVLFCAAMVLEKAEWSLSWVH